MPGRRILLVNPPPVGGIAYTREGRCQEREDVLATTKPPFSLALLAALLRGRGHEVRLVDQTAERLPTEALIDRLKCDGFAPSLVLFPSATPVVGADATEAAKLKRAFGAPLVCFGAHASAAPRESMERAPEVDAMIVGEPEDAALELAALESFEEAERVAALTVRRGAAVLSHRARGVFSGFASMPYPAWDLLPLHRYRVPLLNTRYLMVETSRGCPYSCDFCVAPLYHSHLFRERDAVAVADEIEEGKRRFGITDFYLWGDTVTLNATSTERLCDELVARNLGIRWFGNARADNLTSPEFTRKLRRAGCWMLSLGVESESDAIRRDMLKQLDRDAIRQALRNLREAGIRSFTFLAFGHPGESAESMERTARYARETGPDFANFYPVVPYPGTLLYDRCARGGLLASDDWSRMDYSHYVLRAGGLDEAAVMGAVRRATRDFYLRPSWLARHWFDVARLAWSNAAFVWRVGRRLLSRTAGLEPRRTAGGLKPPATRRT